MKSKGPKLIPFDIVDFLKSPAVVAAYFNIALAESAADPRYLPMALRSMARAAGVRGFNDKADASFRSVLKMLGANGVRLVAEPMPKVRKRNKPSKTS